MPSWRTVAVAVLAVFLAYAISTRPGTTADAFHAAGVGISNGLGAVGQFLDDLIPHDASPGR